MTKEEKIEQMIQSIADMLRTSPLRVEFKVKKRPAGIKIIFEVTQEDMDACLKSLLKKTAI